MASPKPFEPVLYFCAVLAVPDYPIEKLEDALAVRFGPVDLRSEPRSWRTANISQIDSRLRRRRRAACSAR